jgi:hypothetical protein
MKAIKQVQLRKILDAYNREEISYSRMNEMLNELADKFAIGFAEWCLESLLNGEEPKADTINELLQIYKKENKL